MNLSPIDLFVQEKILLAVHKGCTIEDAGDKEQNHLGSLVITWNQGKHPTRECICVGPDLYRDVDGYEIFDNRSVEKVIGLPPTLSRVLHALGNCGYLDNCICESDGRGSAGKIICLRKRLNDDGTDATFRDQSDETKLAIAKLLGLRE